MQLRFEQTKQDIAGLIKHAEADEIELAYVDMPVFIIWVFGLLTTMPEGVIKSMIVSLDNSNNIYG